MYKVVGCLLHVLVTRGSFVYRLLIGKMHHGSILRYCLYAAYTNGAFQTIQPL